MKIVADSTGPVAIANRLLITVERTADFMDQFRRWTPRCENRR